MDYIELTSEQIKEYTNVVDAYNMLFDEQKRSLTYKGGMTWKTVNNTDYLYRRIKGEWRSIGKRTAATKEKYNAFIHGREKAKDMVAGLKESLLLRARFACAAMVNRVPAHTASLLRHINKSTISDHVSVLGTNAIYAYEALAGVRVTPSIMETVDLDFLWDTRKRLDFSSSESVDGFLSLLQAVDRSYVRSEQEFRAVNRNGFIVDLVVARAKDVMRSKRQQMGGESDLKAAEIGSLKWLINSPKIKVPVVDTKGVPVVMTAPDPRCFAIHKLWLSEQPDRSCGKALRDRQQAITVADLVVNKLPQFSFSKDELRMFPEALVDRQMNILQKIDSGL